jgi:hypothetical protein
MSDSVNAPTHIDSIDGSSKRDPYWYSDKNW